MYWFIVWIVAKSSQNLWGNCKLCKALAVHHHQNITPLPRDSIMPYLCHCFCSPYTAMGYPSIGPTICGSEEIEDTDRGNTVVYKIANKIYKLRKGCKCGAFKLLEYTEMERSVCVREWNAELNSCDIFKYMSDRYTASRHMTRSRNRRVGMHLHEYPVL